MTETPAQAAESARRATAMALAVVLRGDLDPEQLTQTLIAELKAAFPQMPTDVDYGALGARVLERCVPFLADWFLTRFNAAELESLLRAFQDPAMMKFLAVRTPLAIDLARFGVELGEAWAVQQETTWSAPVPPQYGKKLRVRFIN